MRSIFHDGFCVDFRSEGGGLFFLSGDFRLARIFLFLFEPSYVSLFLLFLSELFPSLLSHVFVFILCLLKFCIQPFIYSDNCMRVFYTFFTCEIPTLLFLFLPLLQLLYLFRRRVISSSFTLCNSHALVPLCHPLLHSLFFSFVPSGLPLSLTFIAFFFFPFHPYCIKFHFENPFSSRIFSFTLLSVSPFFLI